MFLKDRESLSDRDLLYSCILNTNCEQLVELIKESIPRRRFNPRSSYKKVMYGRKINMRDSITELGNFKQKSSAPRAIAFKEPNMRGVTHSSMELGRGFQESVASLQAEFATSDKDSLVRLQSAPDLTDPEADHRLRNRSSSKRRDSNPKKWKQKVKSDRSYEHISRYRLKRTGAVHCEQQSVSLGAYDHKIYKEADDIDTLYESLNAYSDSTLSPAIKCSQSEKTSPRTVRIHDYEHKYRRMKVKYKALQEDYQLLLEKYQELERRSAIQPT